jgi:hypothetical protein
MYYLVKKIKYWPVKFEEVHWQGISLEAIDFLANLLNKDASCRMTAQQALHHKWLRNSCRAASEARLDAAQDGIKQFVGTSSRPSIVETPPVSPSPPSYPAPPHQSRSYRTRSWSHLSQQQQHVQVESTSQLPSLTTIDPAFVAGQVVVGDDSDTSSDDYDEGDTLEQTSSWAAGWGVGRPVPLAAGRRRNNSKAEKRGIRFGSDSNGILGVRGTGSGGKRAMSSPDHKQNVGAERGDSGPSSSGSMWFNYRGPGGSGPSSAGSHRRVPTGSGPSSAGGPLSPGSQSRRRGGGGSEPSSAGSVLMKNPLTEGDGNKSSGGSVTAAPTTATRPDDAVSFVVAASSTNDDSRADDDERFDVSNHSDEFSEDCESATSSRRQQFRLWTDNMVSAQGLYSRRSTAGLCPGNISARRGEYDGGTDDGRENEFESLLEDEEVALKEEMALSRRSLPVMRLESSGEAGDISDKNSGADSWTARRRAAVSMRLLPLTSMSSPWRRNRESAVRRSRLDIANAEAASTTEGTRWTSSLFSRAPNMPRPTGRFWRKKQ